MCKQDPELGKLWEQTRTLTNEEPHFFHRTGFSGPLNKDVEDHITEQKTPVYKLTWKKGAIHRHPRIQHLMTHQL